MAVGVVVGGRLAEVVEPAGELGRVGADELEHRLALPQRLRRVLEASGWRPAAARGSLRVASSRSLSAPGRVTSVRRSWIVGPRVVHQRAQLAQERREVLGRRLGLGDQHVEVVERRAQVDERRVGAPQRGRQQPERLRERDVLASRSPPPSRSCCRPASARSSRRSATAVTAREELTMKSVSVPSSCGELVDELARGRQERVEVLGRLGRPPCRLPVVLRRRSPG